MNNIIKKILERLKQIEKEDSYMKNSNYLAMIGGVVERYVTKNYSNNLYKTLIYDSVLFQYTFTKSDIVLIAEYINEIVLKNMNRKQDVLVQLLWVLGITRRQKYIKTFKKVINTYLNVNDYVVQQALNNIIKCSKNAKLHLSTICKKIAMNCKDKYLLEDVKFWIDK